MPTPGTISGAPIPNVGDAYNIAAILEAYDLAIDEGLNLKATSQSDRDTRLAGVGKGTVVTCVLSSTSWIRWIKLTDPPTTASWGVIAEQYAPVTTGIITASTNWSVSSQWAQRLNGRIDIYAALTYSGSTITGGTVTSTQPGSLTDVPMCTLQTTYQIKSGFTRWIFPLTAGGNGGASGTGQINVSAQTIYLSTIAPSATVTSGDTVEFSTSYPAA